MASNLAATMSEIIIRMTFSSTCPSHSSYAIFGNCDYPIKKENAAGNGAVP